MTIIQQRYHEACDRPSDINEHLPTLRMYAERCERVTEFGVRGIVSTWAFLAALPTRLRSVDIEHPSKHGGDLAAVEAAAAEAGIDFQFVQCDDLKYGPEETDMLFIDTWHTYEQLSAELNRHAASVTLFIVLHDTYTFGGRGETAGTRGLQPALSDFLATPEGCKWLAVERMENNNGLTVLERKAL